MSVDISALEDAITAVYAADAWFIANVTTIEARYRRIAVDHNRPTFGFERSTELPALIIVTAIQRNGFDDTVRRESVEFNGGGATDVFVPMAITSIAYAADYETAESAIITILENASRVAELQVSNTNDWGADAGTVITSINDGYEIIQEGPSSHIGIGITRFDVQVL